MLEDNLIAQHDQELEFNEHKYPYKPDMIVGLNS